ncbi:hypothetical protein GXN76_01805 [Kroppenstedtia pulmonis]|uniref:Lipoprotein n=1 Tax=Kroppenstedtia pulmonis TaxID=1380685 RepID=A0A7D4B108_9BACL|nr:PCYCGC motif-containing (lipo)protein [Kroppenstedtia pulmonis]QKG83326.1 hypothetical protein GXN76_01805 [Kroppenstedtia pulmonis]
MVQNKENETLTGSWRKILTSISVVLLLGTGAVGCSSDNKGEEHVSTTHPMEDINEETVGIDQLPGFLDSVDPQIRQVYSLVAKHPDLIKDMPCYCGCGDSVGHKSNLSCFIRDIEKDGKVVWDSHGTKCNVCLQIAAEAASMKTEGKSHTEIRKAIDDQYREGYAKPTPTPLPK